MTHGFPQNPSPLFLSHKFPIENRPGLEDQGIQKVLRALSDLHAPDLTSNAEALQKEPQQFRQLVEYLSDWHLVVFLSYSQLFSEVRLCFQSRNWQLTNIGIA